MMSIRKDVCRISNKNLINCFLRNAFCQHFWNSHCQNVFVSMSTKLFLNNEIQIQYENLRKMDEVSMYLQVYAWYEYHETSKSCLQTCWKSILQSI